MLINSFGNIVLSKCNSKSTRVVNLSTLKEIVNNLFNSGLFESSTCFFISTW